ncbi:MAG: T9SS type A sorting domain-containing protein, partial [Bacteroidales bacterium]|nr:T9SS type A sorting domain-containing protein [Bacteroidales bacterium]
DLGFRAAGKNPLYFQRNQLFDLANDPDELVNLFDSKPDTALFLWGKLSQYLKSFPGRPYGEFTDIKSSEDNKQYPLPESKMQIYPNPTEGYFEIQLPESHQSGKYKVVSSTGSLINTGSFSNRQFSLFLTNIPGGCYFITALNNNVSLSGKIVLNQPR